MMSPDPEDWQWREGPVDRADEHFELRYGSYEQGSWNDWLPVAVVGRPTGRIFPVQFLIAEDDRPRHIEAIQSVKEELDLYLVEERELDPWDYAQHHCGTAANFYSPVHWSHIPKD